MKRKEILGRIIGLFIILLAMFACDPDGTIRSSTTSTDTTLVKLRINYERFNSFTIIEIEDCEYMIYQSNGGLLIEHKGNCKNPIHYQVKHDTIYVLKENGLVLQKQIRKN